MASMPSPARAAAAPAFPSAPDNDEWPALSSSPPVSSHVQAVSLQNLDDDEHLNWRMPGASSRFALSGLGSDVSMQGATPCPGLQWNRMAFCRAGQPARSAFHYYRILVQANLIRGCACPRSSSVSRSCACWQWSTCARPGPKDRG